MNPTNKFILVIFWGCAINLFFFLECKSQSESLAVPICTSASMHKAKWKSLGPNYYPQQWLGKVHSIVVDPSDPSMNKVYIGLPGGGVYFTSNFQSSTPKWKCLTDKFNLPGLWVLSMVINTSRNELLVSTGNDGRDGDGIGVFKINLRNNSLIQTTLTLNPAATVTNFSKLAQQPGEPDNVYVITREKVYYSTDFGSTWRLSYDGSLGNFYFYDIQFDNAPTRMDNVVVSGTKVFTHNSKSLTTWNDKTSQLSSHVNIVNLQVESSMHNGSPALFAIYVDNSAKGVFDERIDVSTDGGETWVLFKDMVNGRIRYDIKNNAEIKMHPADPLIIYGEAGNGGHDRFVRRTRTGFAGTPAYEDISTYNSSQYLNGDITHADIRCILLIPGTTPGSDDKLFVGTDGGIMYSHGMDKNFPKYVHWDDKNGTGLNITQFFGLHTTKKGPLKILAGAQDNGGWVYENSNWRRIGVNADGVDGIIEEGDPLKMYIEFDGSNGNASLNYDSNEFKTKPIISVLPPNYSSTFIDDNDKVYRTDRTSLYSLMHGANQTTVFNFQSKLSACNRNLRKFGIESGPNPTLMYVSVDGPVGNMDLVNCSQTCETTCPLVQKLFQSLDGGITWTDITSRFDKGIDINNTDAFRHAYVSSIEINPENRNEAWITFYNFWDDGNGMGKNRVNHTTDGGLTWQDFSTGLLPFPTSKIIYQKGSNGALYLATDVGVYYRDNTMNHWECFRDGMPIVLVTDLGINYYTNKIYASTFGKGIYEGNLVR